MDGLQGRAVVADDDPFAFDPHNRFPRHDGVLVMRACPEVGKPRPLPDAEAGHAQRRAG